MESQATSVAPNQGASPAAPLRYGSGQGSAHAWSTARISAGAMFLLLFCAGFWGCATTQTQAQNDELNRLRKDLESQHRVQASMATRLERLEQRQRTLEAQLKYGAGRGVEQEQGSIDGDSPRQLPVVRLEPRHNPVMDAPEIPTHTELRISDEELSAYTDPAQDLSEFVDHDSKEGDLAFTLALQKYNLGERTEAAGSLRQFATRFPQHSSADNALYLAGMALVAQGRCESAREDFERVNRDYPQGDAAPSALLALGQCEAVLGKNEAAREILQRVIKQYPRSHEASQARRALGNLPEPSRDSRHRLANSLEGLPS